MKRFAVKPLMALFIMAALFLFSPTLSGKGAAIPALAQQDISAQATNAESSDPEANLPYLFAVYAITWVIFFAYLYYLSQRQQNLRREVEELRQAGSHEEKFHDLGDVFLVLVNLARWLDIHAEDALRQANRRFATRYRRMEELAAGRGLDFAGLSLAEKETFWREAKRMEAG